MTTQTEYELYLEQRLTAVEKLADSMTGLDERLDYLSNILTKWLVQWQGLTPGTSQYAGTLVTGIEVGMPLYNVREYPLDTARDNLEIDISGDAISAWTDGTLIGCKVRLGNATEDSIPLDKFNPLTYPKGWDKFYLTTTAQADKILYMFIGRAAGAQTQTERTLSAGRETFYTVRSDKDDHFTGALGQYETEDENLSGLITNKTRISGIALTSDQQLRYKLLFWSRDTFADTNLDIDTFIGEMEMDLTVYGLQIDGTGKWYLNVTNLMLDYRDDDNTNEFHVSLMNMGGTGKTAGSDGEVVIEITYAPRT